MTEKEKMIKGLLYQSFGPELVNERLNVKNKTMRINHDWTLSHEERQQIIKRILGSHGENTYIEAPVYFDYGYNVHVGHNFYANFDCIFLDGTSITFGDNVMIGPRCSFFTAAHPIDKEIRNALYEFSKPITVGSDVWIGGHSVINPGISIGDNVIIGSGSVVTKNIPSDVIAAGNPCKIIRKITDTDKKHWQQLLSEQSLD